MIKAYKEGYPGDGKPFPDGAKMAKAHWGRNDRTEALASGLADSGEALL